MTVTQAPDQVDDLVQPLQNSTEAAANAFIPASSHLLGCPGGGLGLRLMQTKIYVDLPPLRFPCIETLDYLHKLFLNAEYINCYSHQIQQEFDDDSTILNSTSKEIVDLPGKLGGLRICYQNGCSIKPDNAMVVNLIDRG